jgi:hypothetical protein
VVRKNVETKNQKSILRKNVENLIWTGLGCFGSNYLKKYNNPIIMHHLYPFIRNKTINFQETEHI